MRSLRVWSLMLCVGLLGACGGGSGLGQQAECGNGVVEPGEECDASELAGHTCADLNLGGGTLGCAGDCAFDVSGCDLAAECGNDTAEYPEQCDGADLSDTSCVDLGFDGGELACNVACTFDTAACEVITACDGVALEPGEECDGAHLGGATCESLGLGVGELGCDAGCHFDTSDCEIQAECGNDTTEHPELCDGPDLAGADCTDAGFYSGNLACNMDCDGYDTSACAGTCGDDVLNGPEVCDSAELGGADCVSQGQYPGQLACASDCAGYELSGCGGTCGDGVLNGPEACDTGDFGGDTCQTLGFYGGTLACDPGCGAVDDAGCTGFCGDGVLNGPEVCDGADVGGATCSNGLAANCLSDCSGVTCMAVIITEVALGDPDWVELLNVGSQPVALNGWYLEWFGYDNGYNVVSGIFAVPMTTPTPVSLAPGARVVFYDEYNGGGGPPDISPGVLQFHDNIWWGSAPGSVTLYDPTDAPQDFARWGGPDFDPPVGTGWADTPGELPGLNSNSSGLSRQPDDVDTDTAGDFCIAPQTPGVANGLCSFIAPPGHLLVTEIDCGGPDRVELHNPGNVSVDLGGWYLLWLWGNNYGYEVLPAFNLAGGAYVQIVDDCTANCPTVDVGGVIHIENIGWWNAGLGTPDSGALRLLEPVAYFGVDFVRWGGSNWSAGTPDTWSETTPLPAVPAGVSLGRVGATDTNTEGDWCLLDIQSFGGPNVNNDPSDPDPCR